MNYVLLREGNQLPAVGVLQKLLNRTGARLTPDGIFGPRTRDAVQQFQRLRRLGPDGVVGQDTWPRLVAGTNNLNIIDCIDVFDPSLLNLEARDIRRVGGNPILIGGMSNGVEQAISDICRAASLGSVFLVRFHGHGSPGVAGVSDGHGGIPGEHRSSLHPGNLPQLRPVIGRLRFLFSSYGCVQFMHCSTGRGPSGRMLLSHLANELGVPVTAAVLDQLGGGLSTFRFEGPTFTAIPGGGSLQDWSRRLPDFASMTPV
jgi:hypothetical protein